MSRPKPLATPPFEPVREALDEHFEMEYWTQPERIPHNGLLTPRIANGSLETRTKMATIAAGNAIALFPGRRLPNALNPEVVEKSKPPS